MKPDTEKFLKAFIEVYNDFSQIYVDWAESFWKEDDWDINERVELFNLAWNDPFLGDLLKQEMMQKAIELNEAEQEAEEAGEAMVV